MKYNVRVNRTMIDTGVFEINADSLAEAKAKSVERLPDNWDEVSTEYEVVELSSVRTFDEHLDAFKVFDPSYVMDRKAQIDFLEGFVKAWDIMHGMNILSDKVIEAMTKELHLFYDANHIEHDIAEAVLDRLLKSKEYKLQVVRFGNIYFEFMPTEDDQWFSDECFDYSYQEERGSVQVLLKDRNDSVIIHEQDIQK